MAAEEVAIAAFHVEIEPFVVKGVMLPEFSVLFDAMAKLAARLLLSMIDWQ